MMHEWKNINVSFKIPHEFTKKIHEANNKKATHDRINIFIATPYEIFVNAKTLFHPQPLTTEQLKYDSKIRGTHPRASLSIPIVHPRPASNSPVQYYSSYQIRKNLVVLD